MDQPFVKRPTLLLVSDTVDDRRVITSVLNEHSGSIVSVVIPAPAGRGPTRLKIGQEVVVLAVATDRRRVVPIRFATAADIETGQTLTTILLELGGRPAMTTLSLVQSYVEARSIWPERGRLHGDGPPVVEADGGEDSWLTAVELLNEFDPEAFRDTAFLQLDHRNPEQLRLIAPGIDPSRMSSLNVRFVDRDGGIVSEAVGAPTMDLPAEAAVRVEVRHKSINGVLLLPEREATDAPSKSQPSTSSDPPTGSSDEFEERLNTDVHRETFDAYGLLQLLDGEASIPPSLLAEVAARLEHAAPHDVRIALRRGRSIPPGWPLRSRH